MNNEPELSLGQARLAASKARAPRVTELSLKDKIASADYLQHGLLTICVLTMSNGFMMTGVSAAASPENHVQEIGERYAFENAFKQLWWQLEGYLLREKLALQDK